MLVYMPTSGPLSAIPPRIFEFGTTTGPSGTPSIHSHASSGIRPPVAGATTRSPYDCAYAETQIDPSLPVATPEYGPMRPGGMSSEHTHVLSMQNGSWPCGHASLGQSLIISHACAALWQLQPGASEAPATNAI